MGVARYDPDRRGYRIFVGNLAGVTTHDDLANLFSTYGPIVDVWLASNPPGFGFVVFKNACDAEEAVSDKNTSVYQGRVIKVQHARMFRDRVAKTSAIGLHDESATDSSGSKSRSRSRNRSLSRSSRSWSRSSSGHSFFSKIYGSGRKRSRTSSKSWSRSRDRSSSSVRTPSAAESSEGSKSRSRSRSRSKAKSRCSRRHSRKKRSKRHERGHKHRSRKRRKRRRRRHSHSSTGSSDNSPVDRHHSSVGSRSPSHSPPRSKKSSPRPQSSSSRRIRSRGGCRHCRHCKAHASSLNSEDSTRRVSSSSDNDENNKPRKSKKHRRTWRRGRRYRRHASSSSSSSSSSTSSSASAVSSVERTTSAVGANDALPSKHSRKRPKAERGKTIPALETARMSIPSLADSEAKDEPVLSSGDDDGLNDYVDDISLSTKVHSDSASSTLSFCDTSKNMPGYSSSKNSVLNHVVNADCVGDSAATSTARTTSATNEDSWVDIALPKTTTISSTPVSSPNVSDGISKLSVSALEDKTQANDTHAKADTICVSAAQTQGQKWLSNSFVDRTQIRFSLSRTIPSFSLKLPLCFEKELSGKTADTQVMRMESSVVKKSKSVEHMKEIKAPEMPSQPSVARALSNCLMNANSKSRSVEAVTDHGDTSVHCENFQSSKEVMQKSEAREEDRPSQQYRTEGISKCVPVPEFVHLSGKAPANRLAFGSKKCPPKENPTADVSKSRIAGVDSCVNSAKSEIENSVVSWSLRTGADACVKPAKSTAKDFLSSCSKETHTEKIPSPGPKDEILKDDSVSCLRNKHSVKADSGVVWEVKEPASDFDCATEHTDDESSCSSKDLKSHQENNHNVRSDSDTVRKGKDHASSIDNAGEHTNDKLLYNSKDVKSHNKTNHIKSDSDAVEEAKQHSSAFENASEHMNNNSSHSPKDLKSHHSKHRKMSRENSENKSDASRYKVQSKTNTDTEHISDGRSVKTWHRPHVSRSSYQFRSSFSVRSQMSGQSVTRSRMHNHNHQSAWERRHSPIADSHGRITFRKYYPRRSGHGLIQSPEHLPQRWFTKTRHYKEDQEHRKTRSFMLDPGEAVRISSRQPMSAINVRKSYSDISHERDIFRFHRHAEKLQHRYETVLNSNRNLYRYRHHQIVRNSVSSGACSISGGYRNKELMLPDSRKPGSALRYKRRGNSSAESSRSADSLVTDCHMIEEIQFERRSPSNRHHRKSHNKHGGRSITPDSAKQKSISYEASVPGSKFQAVKDNKRKLEKTSPSGNKNRHSYSRSPDRKLQCHRQGSSPRSKGPPVNDEGPTDFRKSPVKHADRKEDLESNKDASILCSEQTTEGTSSQEAGLSARGKIRRTGEPTPKPRLLPVSGTEKSESPAELVDVSTSCVQYNLLNHCNKDPEKKDSSDPGVRRWHSVTLSESAHTETSQNRRNSSEENSKDTQQNKERLDSDKDTKVIPGETDLGKQNGKMCRVTKSKRASARSKSLQVEKSHHTGTDNHTEKEVDTLVNGDEKDKNGEENGAKSHVKSKILLIRRSWDRDHPASRDIASQT